MNALATSLVAGAADAGVLISAVCGWIGEVMVLPEYFPVVQATLVSQLTGAPATEAAAATSFVDLCALQFGTGALTSALGFGASVSPGLIALNLMPIEPEISSWMNEANPNPLAPTGGGKTGWGLTIAQSNAFMTTFSDPSFM